MGFGLLLRLGLAANPPFFTVPRLMVHGTDGSVNSHRGCRVVEGGNVGGACFEVLHSVSS